MSEGPSEKVFLQTVRDLARTCGFREYHPYDSRRSTPGFPDLTMVRGERMLFAELKTEKGRVTPSQLEWLTDLERPISNEVYIWRPHDLEDIATVLSPRYTKMGGPCG